VLGLVARGAKGIVLDRVLELAAHLGRGAHADGVRSTSGWRDRSFEDSNI
jgi:hypothetical protein